MDSESVNSPRWDVFNGNRQDNGWSFRRWINELFAGVLISYATYSLATLLAILLTIILSPFDKLADGFDRILDPPYFLLHLVFGMIAGVISGRRFRLRQQVYVPLFPTFLLVWSILSVGIHMRAYTSLSDMYFSSNSGATEGFYKIALTAPLYTAVAYVAGIGLSPGVLRALAARRRSNA